MPCVDYAHLVDDMPSKELDDREHIAATVAGNASDRHLESRRHGSLALAWSQRIGASIATDAAAFDKTGRGL